ncbi:MAG TPA: SRPBCC domain-containing protein [Terracidiphilus sp.]|nr:SRPBCC domain-containing protein [Terracidiphilus sp.]
MSPITVTDHTIVQEVTIKAPAERIFNALTRPAELLKWWNCEGKFQLIHAECDVRPGGGWLMRVQGANCRTGQPESVVSGEYRTVDPPTTLEFTWNRKGEDYPESLVRWDLDEKNGCTTVRVTHSGLISEQMRARNNGWSLILQLMHDYLSHDAD